MAAKNSEERVKDILLEHVLQDIKRVSQTETPNIIAVFI